MRTEGMPLHGIRILEAGHQWAAPIAMQFLAGMGAEVIKVESTVHPDMVRSGSYPDGIPGERYWNRCGRFNDANRNKRGITLDLTKPEGCALFKQLAAVTDVVAENFTPRVMANFGLDYASLRKVKSDLIMLSITGFGHSGPWREYAGRGSGLEATTSLTYMTGYPGEGPMKSGVPYTDIPAAYHAAFAVLAALNYRDMTGEGQWIDLAMYEIGASAMTEALLDVEWNGRVAKPRGNRHKAFAPQGCYPCAGFDEWLALSVMSEREWRTLAALMGRPELAEDPRFATLAARAAHHDELDGVIAAWTKAHAPQALMERLQRAGLSAGRVLTSKDALLDKHYRQRGAFPVVRHLPETGVGDRALTGMPVRMSATPCHLESPAPGLGQDNAAVLGGLIGLSISELQALQERGIIGDRPVATVHGAASEGRRPSKESARTYDEDYQALLGITPSQGRKDHREQGGAS
ncbi:MAG: CoA transferase [Chloroflexota bacterium]